MDFQSGDRVVVEAKSTTRKRLTCRRRPDGSCREQPAPRCICSIRWDDGHESILSPAAGLACGRTPSRSGPRTKAAGTEATRQEGRHRPRRGRLSAQSTSTQELSPLPVAMPLSAPGQGGRDSRQRRGIGHLGLVADGHEGRRGDAAAGQLGGRASVAQRQRVEIDGQQRTLQHVVSRRSRPPTAQALRRSPAAGGTRTRRTR